MGLRLVEAGMETWIQVAWEFIDIAFPKKGTRNIM